MRVDVRVLGEEDRAAAHALRSEAFSTTARSYDDEADRRWYTPLDRRLGAYDGSRLVGHLASWQLGQSFGGRELPMAGIGGVCVTPAARGTGVASGLLRRALADAHDRGETVSTLYPANLPLYRSMGWQTAGSFTVRTVSTDALSRLPRPGTELEVRPADDDDLAAMEDVHARAMAGATGTLRRPGCFTGPVNGPDGGDTLLVLREDDLVGYLRWHKTASEHGFDLSADELVAVDRDALLTVWRLLAGWYPSVRRVRFVSRPVEPLGHLLGAGPPGFGVEEEAWMLRLVDVAAALRGRGYPPAARGTVDLRVLDPVAPWNDRTLRLTVEEGTADVSGRAAGEGTPVELTAGTLAALFSGWLTPVDAVLTGLLPSSTSARDLGFLSQLFSGPTPWAFSYF